MAYVRVKKIRKNNKEYRYAYLVENKWKKRVGKGSKKGARQKVIGYLGKVHDFPRVNESDFLFAHDIENVPEHFDEHGHEKIIRDIVRHELVSHGFRENGAFYSNGDLTAYIGDDDFFVRNLDNARNQKMVIGINEGYLCHETFHNILNFKADGSEKEIGLNLGNALLDAGLNVPQEIFVELFERLNKNS